MFWRIIDINEEFAARFLTKNKRKKRKKAEKTKKKKKKKTNAIRAKF